jgi:DNA-binding NarL/FixJ family response regulator
MIRVILADDHPVLRQGLRSLLERETDLSIVGEAGDGREALDQIAHLRPDVAVLDLMMPGLGGLEVVRQVRAHHPSTHVVVLSMYANESYVAEALQAGAGGYVLKKATSADLVSAIRAVAGGERYLSPPLTEQAIEAYLAMSTPTSDPYALLTTREREVLHLGAEGLTSPQIAQQLSVSPRTVEMHRANLMRKLGLQNQSELVRFAIQRGLIPLDG